jgi:glycosyltransferase involved in cell wall biosynthesis
MDGKTDKCIKVVQLSSVHPLFDTRIFYKICNSLAEAGYSVDLIIQHSKNEMVNGINVVCLPLAKRKLDRLFKVIPLLFQKAIKYPPGTIFHFHDPELIPIGLLLKLFGYSVIYDVHEDNKNLVLDRDWIPKPFRSILSYSVCKLEKIAVEYLDAVVTVTRYIRKSLGGNKEYIIQNYPLISESNFSGIDLTENKNQRFKQNLLYVGGITSVRGINEIVTSLEIVNTNSDNKVKLLLAGLINEKKLESNLQTKKGWEFVDYRGWINREEFAHWASSSFAGLVIFHPLANHINAQPNKLFEYMMHGIPVIASNFKLWKEIVIDNNCGILVDPESPQEIAEAISWFRNHPDEAKKMGENGRNAILSKYNWKSEEEKLLRLYRSLNKCEVNN